jgi:hypothetical protein
MSNQAYDISYLIESEPAEAEQPALRPDLRLAPGPPPAPLPSIASAQEAMARELLQVAEVHEAFIQQYLRTL